MQLETGFPPVAAAGARALILGSLPGRRSLQERRYYAQPRNAFWPIMGELFGAGPELDYRERLRRLTRRGVALWDVVARGRRPGSLDARLDPSSLVFNDFGPFLESLPALRAICFNGRTAEKLYRQCVLPGLEGAAARPLLYALPSTSPAYASMPYAEKLARWRRVLAEALQEPA